MSSRSRMSLVTASLAAVAWVSIGCNEENAPSTPNSVPPFWESTGGPTEGGSVLSIAIDSGEYAFAGMENGAVFRMPSEGGNWLQVASLPPEVRALVINSSSQLVAGTGANPFFSNDTGNTWTQGTMGLPGYPNSVLTFAIDSKGDIYTGSLFYDEASGGVSRSTDNGASWTLQGLSLRHVYSVARNSIGTMFAGARGGFPAVQGGVFRSTDNGISWSLANSGLPDEIIWSLTFNSSGHIFAGTDGSGVFRSTDNGENWIQVSSGLTSTILRAIVINSIGHLFAATPGGVFRSTNNGTDWLQLNTGLIDISIMSLTIDSPGSIFAGSETAGIFRSVESTVP